MLMMNTRPIEGVRDLQEAEDALAERLAPAMRCRFAVILTVTATTIPITAVTAATTRKLPRQPMAAVENASGAVAISVPMVPSPTCRPASVANRSGGNLHA